VRCGVDEAPDRVLIDRTVADFQPVDSKVIYVRGTDRKLWRENGDTINRILVDQEVAAFQAGSALALSSGVAILSTTDMASARCACTKRVGACVKPPPKAPQPKPQPPACNKQHQCRRN
jgi:hypothetical protein